MDHLSCFKDMFISISDTRKIILFKFLNKNDVVLIIERGFLTATIIRLCLD